MGGGGDNSYLKMSDVPRFGNDVLLGACQSDVLGRRWRMLLLSQMLRLVRLMVGKLQAGGTQADSIARLDRKGGRGGPDWLLQCVVSCFRLCVNEIT